MTVIKDGRSMGEVVFVDQGESGQVPAAVREALSKVSGAMPLVALSDGTGTRVYGTSSHAALLKDGLTGALRDAKRTMRDEVRTGPAPKTAAGTEAGSASSSTVSSGGPSSSNIKVTDRSGVKEIAGAPIEEWTSSKGSKITARVTRVSGQLVTLVSDKGKTLTVSESDLAAGSVLRLHKILGRY